MQNGGREREMAKEGGKGNGEDNEVGGKGVEGASCRRDTEW